MTPPDTIRAASGNVVETGVSVLRRTHEVLALALGFASLGMGCIVYSACMLPLSLLVRGQWGRVAGRRLATGGFRVYLFWLSVIGVGRFDLKALDVLRGDGALIIASNHPGLLDALMVVSRLPNIVCVLKASLLRSLYWGAGSRMAGYIANDQFLGSINRAVEELRAGSQLLLFPEGTRSDPRPLGAFRPGAAFVSHRAQVPIQTVLIEQETDFLGKQYVLLKRPLGMPMRFRVRLGQRFDPPENPREFTATLRAYFLRELNTR